MSANGGPYGSRFTAGYQFPRTDHITANRGQPVLEQGPIGPWRAHVALIPLEGGRPDWWQIEATWTTPAGTSTGYSRPVVGRAAAEEHYRRLADALRDPGAELKRLTGDG